MKVTLRLLDIVVAVITVLATGYAVIHRPAFAVNDLLPGGRRYALLAMGVMAIVLAGLFLIRSRRALIQIPTRIVLYSLVLLVLMTAHAQWRLAELDASGKSLMTWPPSVAKSRWKRLDELTPAQRAHWGANVAAHQLSDSLVGELPLVIPPDWPFPDDVTIAVRRLEGGRAEIWGRAGDGTALCVPIPFHPAPGDSVRQAQECEDATAPPSGLDFFRPGRRVDARPVSAMASVAGSWLQYRENGRNSARVDGGSTAGASPVTGWLAAIDGPVRSSASIVGNVVLLGTHLTGSFEARDLATGQRLWAVRLPNWVHQDAVSDGQIVVVGFGDKWGSMGGRAPSGVAAYELLTGRRLWTHFAESSVMTSPVIRDSVVVYASAAGMLRKRHLVSGDLLDERQLPGGVIMAPPAATGDTLGIALDVNGACAVLISTFEPLWCTTVPGFIKVGHAGPAISDGVMFISGLAYLRGTSFAEFRRLGFSAQTELIRTMFDHDAAVAGQAVLALDLATGRLLWRTRIYHFTRDVEGHTSGTTAVEDSVGVVVLPESDTLVAFSTRTGASLWSAGAREARGAPLVIGSQVILSGRDGVIEVRNRLTGAVSCTLRRRTGYDRGGPVLGGGLVVLANLRGGVEAIPLTEILSCTASSGALVPAGQPPEAPAPAKPLD